MTPVTHSLLQPEEVANDPDWNAQLRLRTFPLPAKSASNSNGSNGKFIGQVDSAAGRPASQREWWLPWSKRSFEAQTAYRESLANQEREQPGPHL